MSKFILKLSVLCLVLIGGCLYFSNGHAAAATAQNKYGCGVGPNNPPAPPGRTTTWGNARAAPNQNQMASIIVYARDSNNNPVNASYTLNSPDGQIYKYLNGGYLPGSATGSITSQTGEYFSGDGGYQCNGWDVIGPGINGQDGNGYVVNCDNGAGYQFQYYIANVSPPAGQSNSTGKWTAMFQGTVVSTDVNGGGNTGGFTIPIRAVNGSNVYVQLIWTPNTWTTSANSSVNPSTAEPGQQVTFTHTITTSGDPSSYSWTVERKYPNDSGPVVARTGNGNGNTTVSITYTIPGGAQDGQQYCQRISFNNQQGGSPPSGSSSNACVTVSTHTNTGCGNDAACRQTSSCTTLTVNPTAGEIKYISIQGTDSDVSNYEIDPGGSSKTWNYNATQQWVTITFNIYTNTGTAKDPVWTYSSTTQPSYHCYHASCSIAQVIDDEEGPPGTVVAGHQFTLQVQVTNDNTDPSAEAIPSSVGGYNFSVTEPPENGDPNYEHHDTGFSLNPIGQSYDEGTVFVNFTAPSNVTTDHINLYPDLEPHASLGDDCSVDVPIYQHFSDTVNAISNPDSTEDPTTVAYGATMTLNEDNNDHQSVNMPVSASAYKKSANGVVTPVGSPSSFYNPGGSPPYAAPSPPGGDGIWSGNYGVPAGSFQAGDEYCSTVTAAYASGYVGPGGDIRGGVPLATDTKCPRIANEPYFKVYNSDISAGGDFDQCTTNGGTLAGYADISDPSGATRGSTTQLSALALLKITGVASAKTSANITGSPTQLTFANTGVQVDSTGNESPVLGGQFGGCRTLTNETAPASASNLAGTSTGAVPAAGSGAYTHTGNLTISGGTLGVNQNVSIFVTGNVYISGNITYGNGWQAGTAPSFIVHATGNVYIDPGVTQLAGVYIAQQNTNPDGTPDTTTGKIYDCANGFAPVAAVDLYNDCKNQLVVTGSFVADQVNLMRSFGSLRDEIPNAATGSVGGSPAVPWGLVWNHYGNPPGGYNCVNVTDPITPSQYTLYDNYLCSPGGSGLSMAWTFAANSGSCNPSPGWSSLNCLQTTGYPYCVQFNTGEQSWDDNYLCFNQNVHPSIGTAPDGRDCTQMNEDADPNGNWKSGYYICIDPKVAAVPPASAQPPTPKGPPFSCSNSGTAVDPKSCAGEIFEYSPALYLSNGGGTTQPSGGGSLQLQSITSLPPVL